MTLKSPLQDRFRDALVQLGQLLGVLREAGSVRGMADVFAERVREAIVEPGVADAGRRSTMFS